MTSLVAGLLLLGASISYADGDQDHPDAGTVDAGAPRDAGSVPTSPPDAGTPPVTDHRPSSIYAMGCAGTSASVVLLFGMVALIAPRRRR